MNQPLSEHEARVISDMSSTGFACGLALALFERRVAQRAATDVAFMNAALVLVGKVFADEISRGLERGTPPGDKVFDRVLASVVALDKEMP